MPVNTAVMGKQVWDKLKLHPAFLERVKYTNGNALTTDIVASLLEVDRIIVAAAGYNNTKEGQTDAMSYIWGKDILLAYVPTKMSPKMIGLGLTYRWNKRQKVVQRLRGSEEEDRKVTRVRVGEDYYDQNIVAATCAYLVKNAVA